jgi:hypothetical protein
MPQKKPICISVPAEAEYAIVIRMALGGIGLVHNLDIDQVDDLMAAADESMDLLLNQPRMAKTVEMTCSEQETGLMVQFTVVWADKCREGQAADVPMSRAVLSTLIAHVQLQSDDYGVKGISLLQPLCHG